MKKICVVTATRAEFGLLLPVIKKLNCFKEIECQVIVTGAHLSQEFGMTKNEIIEAGIEIKREIDIQMGSDMPSSISKTMGVALISFAEFFKESRPDALLVLGDRYEMLSVCCAAMNERIPIIHMYGGDKTEGAIDETIRHMITKMSHLHFTATEECRRRVIQLGENPDRVFFVGSTGIENVLKTDYLSRVEVERVIGIELGEKYAVATFHPVTLEADTAEKQTLELLDAMLKNKSINFLFTKSNSDLGGMQINSLIEKYSRNYENIHLVDSLGVRNYLSAVVHSDFVIGNSSSGIAEAPALGIPSINIGDRQKGRLRADSVIDCEPQINEICEAIEKVMDKEFRSNIERSFLYGDGNTSEKVADIIMSFLNSDKWNIKKQFHDLSFEY